MDCRCGGKKDVKYPSIALSDNGQDIVETEHIKYDVRGHFFMQIHSIQVSLAFQDRGYL